MASNSIKVFIKVRPLIAREKHENASSVWQITGNTLKSTDKQYEMTFDEIYDETRSTQDLFEALAKPIVTSALKGINGTIFAYGQTSSGKTYTMMGDEENPGIIPLTVREIFEQIANSDDREFLLRIGYIEIYNEKIFDLLDEKKAECTKIHEPTQGEVNVNQRELVANSEEQILHYYEQGNKVRRTGETNMNERSSRSHTIFRIWIESRVVGSPDEDATQVSHISLVDLAGSERANQTRAEGDRLKEGGHINKSLLSLGNVIRVLSDTTTPPSYVNYRDSKLTRILSASIGGNSMTSIICTVTPAALDETFSTLVFAQNAKKIKNEPKVNEVMSDTVLMRRMQKEIQSLKNELDSEKSRNTELQQIQRLKNQIQEREDQFLHSHNMTVPKAIDVRRRRTWAPSTYEVPTPKAVPLLIRLEMPYNPFSASAAFVTTERFSEELDNEEFVPGEEINLDRTLSPGERNTAALSGLISTPREMKKLERFEDSPNPMKMSSNESLQARIKFLEEELQELNDFKKIENTVGDDHKKLAYKLNYANDHIATLELKLEELQKQLAEKDGDMQVKTAKAERDKALKEKAEALNILSSAEYEHELFRERAKKREAELVITLDEARDDSKVDALKAVIAELEAKVNSLESAAEVSPKLLSTIKLEQIDMGAGGDSVVSAKIAELELKLKAATDELDKVKQGLHDKKNELSRVRNDYDEVSSQLVDSIEETDKLTAKLAALEVKAASAEKCQVIEEILCSIQAEEEPAEYEDFEDDDTVQAMLMFRNEFLMLKQNDSAALELQVTLDALRTENMQLKNKLYPIHESATETENELKDQVDSLAMELNETTAKLEVEAAKKSEAEETIEKLTAEVQAASKRNAELQATIDGLEVARAENSKTDDEVRQLKEDLDVATKAKAELEAAIASLEEMSRSVQSKAEEESQKFKDDLEAAAKAYDDLEDELAALKAEKLEFSQSNNDENAKLVEDLQSKLSASFERQLQLLTDNERISKDCDEKLDKIRYLEDAMSSKEAELSSEIADLKFGLQSLMALGEENVRLKQMEKEHNRLVVELTDKMTEIEKKSAEVEAGVGLSDIHTQRIRELEQNDMNMKRKFDELDAELVKLEETNNSLQAENELLVGRVEELKQSEDKIWEIKEQNLDYEIKISELQDGLEALKQQLAEKPLDQDNIPTNTSSEFDKLAQSALVEQQLADALEKLAQTTSNFEETMKKLESLEDELKQSKEALEQLPEVVHDYDTQKALSEAQEKIAALEADLKEKSAQDSQIIDLNKEIDELKTRIKTLTTEHGKISLELGEIQKTAEDSAAIPTLKAKLEEVQRLVETKEESIKILESCLKDKNQEIEELASAVDSTAKDSKEVENLKKQLEDLENEQNASVATVEALKAELTLMKVEKLTRDEEYESLCETSKELIYNCNVAKEQCKDLEQSNAKIEAENTNLQSKLLIIEEERKHLENRLKEKTEECMEVQRNVKRRSLDTDKKTQQFEMQKQELTQQIGALQAQKLQAEQQLSKVAAENVELKNLASDSAVKHEAVMDKYNHLTAHLERLQNQKADVDDELRNVKAELTKLSALQDENDRLKVESSDNDVKFTMLDEKHSQLAEHTQQLEKELDDLKKLHKPQLDAVMKEKERLEKENDNLTQKMIDHTTEVFSLNQCIANLRSEIDSLKSSSKKSLTPEGRKSKNNELYVSQNEKMAQEGFKSTPTRVIERSVESKHRRQSIYDSRRRLSDWERFKEIETQTENVSDICACKELTEKVTALSREVRLKECKINSMDRFVKHNPLKPDLDEAKKHLADEQRRHSSTKSALEATANKIHKLEHKIEVLSKNQVVAKQTSNKASQAVDDSTVEKSEYDLLEKRFNDMKRVHRQLQEKVKELENDSKENVHKDTNIRNSAVETENQLLKKKLQELEEKQSQTDDAKDFENMKSEHELLKKKYDTTRRLCNLRNDDIAHLKAAIESLKEYIARVEAERDGKKENLDKMFIKYSQMKELCTIRLEKIYALRARLGEGGEEVTVETSAQ